SSVTVVDIEASAVKGPRCFTEGQGDELRDHLCESHPSLFHRLVICENLSAEAIEIIGGRYSLDPHFFENHIREIELHLGNRWTGDRSFRVESPVYEILNRDFCTIQYSRPYCIQDWPSLYEARLDVNVPRLGNLAQN